MSLSHFTFVYTLNLLCYNIVEHIISGVSPLSIFHNGCDRLNNRIGVLTLEFPLPPPGVNNIITHKLLANSEHEEVMGEGNNDNDHLISVTRQLND